MQAERDDADDEVILAAFLHDVGHLVGMDRGLSSMTYNNRNVGTGNHELVGAEFLRTLNFPTRICDIVGGHVNAKRYLVYKHKDYYEKASKQTLEFQGGAMTSPESSEFEKSAVFDCIIKMRRWDEQAKDTTVKADDVDKYKQLCTDVLNKTIGKTIVSHKE